MQRYEVVAAATQYGSISARKHRRDKRKAAFAVR
jgi:hypothetical protein